MRDHCTMNGMQVVLNSGSCIFITAIYAKFAAASDYIFRNVFVPASRLRKLKVMTFTCVCIICCSSHSFNLSNLTFMM